MTTSFLKKISLAGLFAIACISSAMDAKKPHCKDDKHGCESGTHLEDFLKDCKFFKECLEKELSNRLISLESDLAKKFAEQNKMICSSLEALNACLKDFFDSQKDASDARLRDFTTTQLDKTEKSIEDFIGDKMQKLREELCELFKLVNCNVDLLACKVDDVASDVDCIANALFDFLVVANGGNFLNGALDAAIAQATKCLNTNDNCLVACCEPTDECSPVL